MLRANACLYLLLATLSLRAEIAGARLPSIDFTSPAGRAGWAAWHDVSKLSPAPEGLRIEISGPDPYIGGPSFDFPEGTDLWLRLRLKSDQAGIGQLFYFKENPTEPDSVRFPVLGGQWVEVRVRMPALGRGYHLRFDPPGEGGSCLLAALSFEERTSLAPPAWPVVQAVTPGPDALSVASGHLLLAHQPGVPGAFALQVDGVTMASGNTRPMIGFLRQDGLHWLDLTDQRRAKTTVRPIRGGLAAVTMATDDEGAVWRLVQTFQAGRAPGAIEVATRWSADQDRHVAYFPILLLHPGLGSFGTNKTQALFAGLEYLENEPSSSEADVRGPNSRREIPDAAKITLPLMALSADDRWVGLSWRAEEKLAGAVFDSPDRLYHSGAHVMGLIWPGSNGANREENSLLPYETVPLQARHEYVAHATLLGGPGQTIVPAVQLYVRLAGLPKTPPGPRASHYFNLAARGWLDSKIAETHLYRHAAAPNFHPAPAADAAYLMEWLSSKVDDPGLAPRLREASAGALQAVPPANRAGSQIGHVRYPVAPLAYGGVLEASDDAARHARALLGRFQGDGIAYYQPPAAGPDYSKTHWSREANGLAGQLVEVLLENAVLSGDASLIHAALQHLRGLERFSGGVPRGAQTWEVPLHTPDILAAAHLVKAFTLGYQLTGDPRFLGQARYWAWTGVPFVYLVPPTPEPVGVYSTIAVLGATSWVAPFWIGTPVQWCGLVYADALQQLQRFDRSGPWKTLADGIVAAGIQHTYPASDRSYQGLLPDSYNLRPQTRNGPAINPATLLVPAIDGSESIPLYDNAVFRGHHLIVHAAGSITKQQESAGRVRFHVRPWPAHSSFVFLTGLDPGATIKLNGVEAARQTPHEFDPPTRRLALQIQGETDVELGGLRSASPPAGEW